jgi:predicted phage-related endonuclease
MEKRKGKLTASAVACLMTGNTQQILDLWRLLTGDPTYEEPDLSEVWAVQLGLATEQLNLDYYERKNRAPVVRRGEVVVHPRHDWAAATIDGWDDTLGCCIEAKHVGGREPLEVVIDRYQPQVQWQMEVTGAKQCALSVIMGASEPIVEYIERDAEYAAEMIVRGQQLMRCVELRTPPVALPAVPPPIDASKYYDMTGNEAWQRNAEQWLQVKGAAETAKDCEKALKAIVPEDAKKCTGYGVVVTRDRAKRLYLRELT